MLAPTLLLLMCVAAPEPSEVGSATLSLDRAVELALGRSPTLVSAKAAGDAARARLESAGSAWLPRVVLEARYRYQGPVAELVLDTGLTLPGQTEPLVMRRELGSSHNADAFVSVAWRALDFGVRSARVEAADVLAKSSSLDTQARAIELAYATRVAYLGLLLAEDGRRTTGLALELAQATRDDAANKKAAGLGNELALAGAELRVAELEARASEALESVVELRVALASLVGVAVAPNDTLETALVRRPDAPAEHPTLLRLRATEAAFHAQERALRKSRLPTVDLFARAGVQLPATLVDTEEAGLAWALGASLTWELYDGGRLGAEADEARARAREARAGRLVQAEELARLAAAAEARRVAADALLTAAERRLAAAETYLVVARGAAQAGTGRLTEVQAAEVGLDEARLARSRALHQKALAEAQRRRALGTAELHLPQETAP